MERTSTIPQNLNIQISINSGSKEYDYKLRNELLKILSKMGKCFDISELAGVVVASDYGYALANLDRGMDGLAPESYTNHEIRVGSAKTSLVIHDEKVKSSIVLDYTFIKPLIDLNNEIELNTSIYTIAHECGHVEFYNFFERKIQGFYLKYRYSDSEEEILLEFATKALEEYAACLLSAPFGGDVTSETLITLFMGAIESAIKRKNNTIKNHALDQNIDLLLTRLKEDIWLPLQCAARLQGHVVGLNQTVDFASLIAGEEDKIFFLPLINELIMILHDTWDCREEWKDLTLFEQLKNLGKKSLDCAGLKRISDGQEKYL